MGEGVEESDPPRQPRPCLALGHLFGRQQQRPCGPRRAVRRLGRAGLDLAAPPGPGQLMGELRLGRGIGGREDLHRAGGEGRPLSWVQLPVPI